MCAHGVGERRQGQGGQQRDGGRAGKGPVANGYGWGRRESRQGGNDSSKERKQNAGQGGYSTGLGAWGRPRESLGMGGPAGYARAACRDTESAGNDANGKLSSNGCALLARRRSSMIPCAWPARRRGGSCLLIEHAGCAGCALHRYRGQHGSWHRVQERHRSLVGASGDLPATGCPLEKGCHGPRPT